MIDRFALGASGSAALGSLVGLGLVLLGALASGVGAYRFVRTEREIDDATYSSSMAAHLVLTGAIVLGAIAVAVFLVVTPAQ